MIAAARRHATYWTAAGRLHQIPSALEWSVGCAVREQENRQLARNPRDPSHSSPELEDQHHAQRIEPAVLLQHRRPGAPGVTIRPLDAVHHRLVGAKRSVSLQVKFSRDYVATDMSPIFRARLRACGWWTFNHAKLHASRADYWVLVLLGFNAQSTDFVIIPPSELLTRLNVVRRPKRRRIQSYVRVTEADACWETRGLMRADQLAVADGTYKNPARALTRFLNNWSPIERLTT